MLGRVSTLTIPVDTYDPHAAIARQFVKVQGHPSCAKHGADEEDCWKADVIEIRRCGKRNPELGMVGSLGKP